MPALAFGLSEIGVTAEAQGAGGIPSGSGGLRGIPITQQMHDVFGVRVMTGDALETLDEFFATRCDASGRVPRQVTGDDARRGVALAGELEDVGMTIHAVRETALRAVADGAASVNAVRAVVSEPVRREQQQAAAQR
jgi:hypothetical protein